MKSKTKITTETYYEITIGDNKILIYKDQYSTDIKDTFVNREVFNRHKSELEAWFHREYFPLKNVNAIKILNDLTKDEKR